MKVKRAIGNTDANVQVAIVGAISIALGVLIIFVCNGFLLPTMYETSENIVDLHAVQPVTGEDFVGDYTPVELDNAPIIEDSERVYSEYLWSEYNCTADPWASIERTDENCTCGCDDALYKVLVSWWDWEEIEEDWEDPCIVDASYQWFGPPEENYTCDCGCDNADDIWIYPVGVYDLNFTDPNPENWTAEYNYTICYADDYLGIMMDFNYDEENNTYIITTACNVSQFYNVSEQCDYHNVTYDYWDLETLCTETGDCGCTEDDQWFGSWDYEWDITYCTDWNVTNCSCDGDTVEETVCADSEYTWYRYNYSDPCEAVYDLSILTACNGLEEEYEWIEEVYCYNETNWNPEWPPWNYTSDIWFASDCVEEGEGEYNETEDYTMNYPDGEINITEGGNMFEGWDYLIDYDIFIETTGYQMRQDVAASGQTIFNVIGLVFFIAGMLLIISQFTPIFQLFKKGGGAI
jgi:hypothetical protein